MNKATPQAIAHLHSISGKYNVENRQKLDKLMRFLTKINITEGCWEWKGQISASGYGIFSDEGVQVPAHRYSIELAGATVPEGYYACHHCDNRKCVRPDHLFVGTQTDNMQDCCEKGRLNPANAIIATLARYGKSRRGDQNGRCQLTEDQVRFVRDRMYRYGDDTRLGKEWGVNPVTVGHARRRISWRHLP